MNTYGIEFYDLTSRALGGNDPKLLQGFLNDVMAKKYNALQLDGFEWDEMQLDCTYEQLQGEVGLNVMASYVDADSPAKPTGHAPIQLATGKIPGMKMVEYFNEDKLRKQYILEQRFGATSERVANSAFDALFNTADTLIGGHTNALTYQRHQIVSTGKFELTDTNNPNGIVNQTFAAHVPSANVKTLTATKRWWTDADYETEGTTCNPIKDLKEMVRAARLKGVSCHFEIDANYFDIVLGHSKVQAAIGAALYPLATAETQAAAAAVQSDDIKKVALERIVGVPIKVIDSVVSVEKWDADSKKLVRPTFRAFEGNVIVLVPDGKIGTVKCVEPIAIAGGTYATFYNGRLLLTVGSDYVKKCQSFSTEMTALAVPTLPQYFWYLHPYSA
jgi:hypothetical protein